MPNSQPRIQIEGHPPCALLDQVQTLRSAVEQQGQTFYAQRAQFAQREVFKPSILNLSHYLALRRHDLYALQLELMHMGFASLGRIESNVLGSLLAVERILQSLCDGRPFVPPDPATSFAGMNRLIDEAVTVLGPRPPARAVRIMVTLPSEAADDPAFVRGLMERGMNCVRINCAHDDAEAWAAMIANVKQAVRQLGRACPIYMDIGGPKIRTEAISFGKKHLFYEGETLLLTRGDPTATEAYPYQVSCAVPEVLDQPQVGETVWFDDGKIGTRIVESIPEGLVLKIEKTSPEGTRIRLRKGINFPDTHLAISPLTPKDRQDLDFIAHHADMVGYSFVQTGEDVALLQRELSQRLDHPDELGHIALIAKIETKQAVTNLPDIIMRGAGRQPFGVMVARGDLAVEIGFERLAEMQEEILWICEAAHIPVIWATQVLESTTKRGMVSRAEITDAASSVQAECVMLNKGDYVADAVTILNDVLIRMAGHQYKKLNVLRALHSWEQYVHE